MQPLLRPFPALFLLAALAWSITPVSTQAMDRPGQGLSRAEKTEAKLRVAMLKANKAIHGPWIKAGELLAILEDTNLVLIDVRQTKEQEISMLPHAMTTAEFAEHFRHGIPQGKRIVVYCTIGYRSGKYAEQLEAMKIKSENLEGGILMWSFAGGKLRCRNTRGEWVETNRIHVYDGEWNLVHPDYVGVLP